ncbi:hypothetical protein [Rhizobium rhizogenes]|nr:hypothetical protein [Rhizobium rhizogenes]
MSIVYAFAVLIAVIVIGCWYGLKRLGPEPIDEPTHMKKEI